MFAGLAAIDHDLVGWGWSLWDFNWYRRPDPAGLAERLAGRVSDGSIIVLHRRAPRGPGRGPPLRRRGRRPPHPPGARARPRLRHHLLSPPGGRSRRPGRRRRECRRCGRRRRARRSRWSRRDPRRRRGQLRGGHRRPRERRVRRVDHENRHVGRERPHRALGAERVEEGRRPQPRQNARRDASADVDPGRGERPQAEVAGLGTERGGEAVDRLDAPRAPRGEGRTGDRGRRRRLVPGRIGGGARPAGVSRGVQVAEAGAGRGRARTTRARSGRSAPRAAAPPPACGPRSRRGRPPRGRARSGRPPGAAAPRPQPVPGAIRAALPPVSGRPACSTARWPGASTETAWPVATRSFTRRTAGIRNRLRHRRALDAPGDVGQRRRVVADRTGDAEDRGVESDRRRQRRQERRDDLVEAAVVGRREAPHVALARHRFPRAPGRRRLVDAEQRLRPPDVAGQQHSPRLASSAARRPGAPAP